MVRTKGSRNRRKKAPTLDDYAKQVLKPMVEDFKIGNELRVKLPNDYQVRATEQLATRLEKAAAKFETAIDEAIAKLNRMV